MASDISLVFLGTASAQPSSTRNMSSLAVTFGGGAFLVDCGEGTQHQIRNSKSSVKASKISKIFITHNHGDHLFGLPGLLCTISGGVTDEEKVIDIYGLAGIRQYLRMALQVSNSNLVNRIRVHEFLMEGQSPSCGEEGKLRFELIGDDLLQESDGLWRVRDLCPEFVEMIAGPITHTVPCVGFIFKEANLPGSLNADKVKPLLLKHKAAFQAQGVKNPMMFMADLKNGKSVALPDGSQINPDDVVGPPKIGRKLVILGDTSDSQSLIEESMGCSVVVHEATNAKVGDEEKSEEDVERDAISHGHSTPQMAGNFAKAVQARSLVLNHFSSRYKGDQEPESIRVMTEIEELAKITFQNDAVTAAYDFLSIPIPK